MELTPGGVVLRGRRIYWGRSWLNVQTLGSGSPRKVAVESGIASGIRRRCRNVARKSTRARMGVRVGLWAVARSMSGYPLFVKAGRRRPESCGWRSTESITVRNRHRRHRQSRPSGGPRPTSGLSIRIMVEWRNEPGFRAGRTRRLCREDRQHAHRRTDRQFLLS